MRSRRTCIMFKYNGLYVLSHTYTCSISIDHMYAVGCTGLLISKYCLGHAFLILPHFLAGITTYCMLCAPVFKSPIHTTSLYILFSFTQFFWTSRKVFNPIEISMMN